MTPQETSPRINRLSWGQLEVEGSDTPYKDAKLFPGGSREWNWSETGTDHTPGIQPADVEELLESGARIVILSRGQNGRLEVCEETMRFLEERDVTVHVLPTGEAVRLYNELRGKEAVGGLFHTTC